MTTMRTPRPVAVIGGAVGDLILNLPRLPLRGEDMEAQEGGRTIGGCAFNVARALCRMEIPVINGMPVGNGPWGALAEQAMTRWRCRCCCVTRSRITAGVWPALKPMESVRLSASAAARHSGLRPCWRR
nr:PfkB family carbohydrate kinase [Edwardsiella ictaluri]